MDLPERAHTQLPGVGGAGAGVTVEEDEFVVGKSPNEDPTLIVSALWNRIATAPPPEEYPREELPNERHVSTTDDVKESNWESVIADRLRGAVSLSYTVGDLVRTIIPISFEDMGGGTVAAGEIARVTQVPGEEEGSIAEIQLSDGRKVDAFSHEVEHIDYRFMAVVGALVVLRSEAIITAYQATIYRRLERVRQQVVADFEASLVLRPPGLELLPQKGRDEAFRLHVDNTYTSNMKAVLHDRYKKMYGKAYIEVVGPTDPTPDQKKYRKMGAALVGGAVAASVLALVESGACPNVLDCAKVC